MPEYRVKWEIDLDAHTPEDAARLALASIRREDSTAHVFEVVWKRRIDGHTQFEAQIIDLDTICPACEALRPDLAPGSVCEHCGHVEPDDEPDVNLGRAFAEELARLAPADDEPCECEPGATVAGVHWPTATDGDGSHPWVERCDMCKRYPDDESAAEAVAAAVGGKVEWATVSGGRSPYVVDPRIASDYAIAHSTAESARIEAEDRGVDKL